MASTTLDIFKREIIGGSTTDYRYAYDEDGRLSRVFANGALTEAYEYDADGIRISDLNAYRRGKSKTYRYDGHGQLKQAGETYFEHDDAGRLSSRSFRGSSTEYLYNDRDFITDILIRNNGDLSQRIHYTYDAKNRRTSISLNGTLTTTLEWDGLRLKRMFDGSWWSFEYENDCILPTRSERNCEKFALSYDHVGSLRCATDERGHIVFETLYDSFGNTIQISNPDFGIPFAFAGGLHDYETGLIHFLYRDYAPDVARWTTKDPLGYAAGDKDLYGYCLDDPINLKDFTGTKATAGDIFFGAGSGFYKGAQTGATFSTGAGLGPIPGAIAGGFLGSALGMLSTIFVCKAVDGINSTIAVSHKDDLENTKNKKYSPRIGGR
ncbi:RHS repeat-associated protein [Desulfobaculum xiamenense]|uniref:RHS repeat-associated protein n=1 Tax=Desulfobaculum xiamenense TaxID=995050 RepID=A0A846QQR0_9BACT|nr:RHS repeat-associated core domain-containing protein [Desulfobaculum xiamenense]NJB67544.1 RHS repeat-associated protein [Desulfobaculum xiamenense]